MYDQEDLRSFRQVLNEAYDQYYYTIKALPNDHLALTTENFYNKVFNFDPLDFDQNEYYHNLCLIANELQDNYIEYSN